MHPVLSAPDMLEATEGQEVAFPIALDGTDGVPPGSIIVIRGLPSGSTLSNGWPRGETEWDLKTDEIGDLHLTPTAAADGESKLTIQLVAPNNLILASTATRLRIAADPRANIAADAIEAEPAEEQVSDLPDQEPQATVMEESVEAGTSMADFPPLPTRRPSSRTNDDGQANWIRPSALSICGNHPLRRHRSSVYCKGRQASRYRAKAWLGAGHQPRDVAGRLDLFRQYRHRALMGRKQMFLSPLLAPSGRTHLAAPMSVNDPKRTY